MQPVDLAALAARVAGHMNDTPGATFVAVGTQLFALERGGCAMEADFGRLADAA